ncbi:MAG: hypothetical protein QOJ98_2447 [Acidobacteriota bacterium]|nr:hypothetical protein [Acidobacteriota bacterium]
MTDTRQGWQEALAPTPECIEIARFGEELDAASLAHLESCARCQAELVLFREFQREESSGEEAAAGQWIAGELQRRFEDSGKLVAFRPKRFQALYAAAAVVVMVIGAGWWMQLREPSIDGAIGGAPVYRSARLDVIAPAGELAQAPNELRWRVVPGASRYHIRILEIDATLVWSGNTTEPYVALPPAVVAEFVPGKTLLWTVTAFQGDEKLAESETQTVRVSVTPPRKDP